MRSKISLLSILLINGTVYANDTIDDITQDLFDGITAEWAQRTNNKKKVVVESPKAVDENSQKPMPQSLPKSMQYPMEYPDALPKKNVTYEDLFENFEHYRDQNDSVHLSFDTETLIKEAELNVAIGEKVSDKKGIALKIAGCGVSAAICGLLMVCPWLSPLAQQFENHKIAQGITSVVGYCGTIVFGVNAYIFNADLKLRAMKLATKMEHEAILKWLKTRNKE